jgi:polygalacturonase
MTSSSRRTFLKATGVAAAGSFTGGMLLNVPAAHADPAPWEQVPVILGRIVPPTFPNRVFDIRDFGAVGNNTTDCTPAIRDAIAACDTAGGGRVLIPGPGTYRTGKIHLRSNVELHVASGATIRFRTDIGSFLPTVFTRWQGIECFNFSPFIYAIDATNVAITGPGTIDGNAQAGPWFGFDSQRGPDWDRLQQMAVDNVPIQQRQFGDGHFLKPNLIQLYRCRNVLISDVSIRNAAMWAVHPVLSQNVTVRNVNIFSRGAMVDGVDPESCADVHITGCSFDTGDDGTVIKSGRDTDGRRVNVPSENIVIEDCDYFGRWGAITVGSEMSGGVRNVFAQDCRIHPGSTYRSFHVVYIKTNRRRGGIVDGIHVRRITGGPVDRGLIHVDMNYSLTGPGFGAIVLPTVRNIHLDGLTLDDSPYALRVNGIAESPLTHLHISNSTFTRIDAPTPQVTNARDVVFTNTTINGQPIGAPANRYEAENATISAGVVESNHAGFSGTGFVNYDNAVGSFVEFTVNAAAAGSATLAFRFANGTTTDRPMTITVNGTAVATGLSFAGTGAWTTWQTRTVAVTLAAGTNRIRATATTANGGPNLDYLEVR